ncbi:GvpL/GvpF family gas vesicle protein [Actinomadura terrae]|uniref:GvpL/GvpF family gas vesicle protein n=1 Tax=Actinomadura terrae TaxID=604353 RepID=UPI001FA6FC48|nr:GvpL/GvpF family gas vesicle protein [Actinomadura terrae]
MTEAQVSGGTAVYLYGVARDLDPAALPVAGVAGAPVRGVLAAGLTALVSTVRLEEYGEAALRANMENMAWLEATARTHHEVVDRAARAAPTAPVRIATIYSDDDRVAEVLTAEGDRFGEILDRVAGRTEWGVKAYAVPAPVSDGGDAPSADTGSGTAYLRGRQREQRRRADAGRRLAELAGELHAELAGRAVASRHHPAQDARLSGRADVQVLNAAYLLDDDRVEEFRAAVRAAGERVPDLDVEVTGPWPPYSFIEGDR